MPLNPRNFLAESNAPALHPHTALTCPTHGLVVPTALQHAVAAAMMSLVVLLLCALCASHPLRIRAAAAAASEGSERPRAALLRGDTWRATAASQQQQLQHGAKRPQPGVAISASPSSHASELVKAYAAPQYTSDAPDDGRVQAPKSEGTVQYTAEAEADRVEELPGWGRLHNLTMFSGYITVDEDAGRALFYVLVESLRGVTRDPLLLWLNGGPGCSSVGGGFMSELGPFYPKPGGRTLQANPWAWNRVATMVFVEVPAFTGFSYSNTSGDAVTGDSHVVRDTHTFLYGLLQRFPHLQRSELLLSGESYAGHYVPLLALNIVQVNAKVSQQVAATANNSSTPGSDLPAFPLRLQGFMVGNPSTDRVQDRMGAADFLWSHGLISDSTAEEIRVGCNRRPDKGDAESLRDAHSSCNAAFNRARKEMGSINIYEIYADICLPRQARSEARALARLLMASAPDSLVGHPSRTLVGEAAEGERVGAAAMLNPTMGTGGEQDARTGRAAAADWFSTAMHAGHVGLQDWLVLQWYAERSKVLGDGHPRRRSMAQHISGSTGAAVEGGSSDEPQYDPCVDDEVETYLNLPEVQRALHANVTGLPYRWVDCSDALDYSVSDLWTSMLPVYSWLINNTSLRMLVFSGDVDGMVPLVGTRRWVASLGLPLRRPDRHWAPWYTATKQVGGYVAEYEGLTFATVRNAGHMVPYVQPERMLHLLTSFLQNTALNAPEPASDG